MIRYRHFAMPNLYLANGYSETHFEDGIEREYLNEDGLEHCVRRVLLRYPHRFNGHQLRFMRRGLGLTQASFGELIDRTEQAIARWEKSSSIVPRFVDLAVRSRFAAQFERDMTVAELLGYADGLPQEPLPEKITLTCLNGSWTFKDVSCLIGVASFTKESSTTGMVPSTEYMFRVLERTYHSSSTPDTKKPELSGQMERRQLMAVEVAGKEVGNEYTVQ